jgi:hypothetical protein
MRKRRCGFPSETHVRRGDRVVHGDKELIEKLGGEDLRPVRLGTPLSSGAAAIRAGMIVRCESTTFRE